MQHQAAASNAHWCDAILAAHGIATQTTDAIWFAKALALPFYPAIITLTPDAGPAVSRAIAERGHLGAVKDSFADLDLTTEGYKVVIDGVWLAAAQGLAPSDMQTIETPAALKAWNERWSASEPLPDTFRMFPDSLLARPDIRFAAFGPPDAPIAGGALNHAAGVTSLSNLFGTGHCDLHHGLAALAQTIWPDAPVVMWDADTAAAPAISKGFRPIGPMRVWAS
jgi:hypothetical protein